MVNEKDISHHPTIEALTQWRRGEVDAGTVLAIGTHLASCDYCVSLATQRLGLNETARALSDDLAEEDEHPDVERDLFALVDGTAGRQARNEIERHLAVCASCSDTVADLRAVAVPQSPPATRWWPIAIAASIAIIVISAALWPRRNAPPQVLDRTISIQSTSPTTSTPVATPAGYSNPVWDVLVAGVRKGAPIEMPDVLRAIRPNADILRGGAEASDAFRPAGVIVKSARPELGWPAGDEAQPATQYVVQIFHGDEEVARSGILTRPQWRLERNLRRGATYTWQVRVTQDAGTQILPTAPAPVAQFHVLDAATFAELEAAERDHPGDHLLLGLLHARAGLAVEARTHLGRVTDARDAEVARRAAREIDSWRIGR